MPTDWQSFMWKTIAKTNEAAPGLYLRQQQHRRSCRGHAVRFVDNDQRHDDPAMLSGCETQQRVQRRQFSTQKIASEECSVPLELFLVLIRLSTETIQVHWINLSHTITLY